MDLKDATLMMLSESADQPTVASIAQSVYQRLANSEPVDYRLLDELIGQASGKGVLRALHAKYSPAAYEAIIGPILTELGRQKPIRSRRYSQPVDPEADPLRAGTWPTP
ncbi:MAG: hypothetical protein QOH87_5178 [Trebonia sp.]|jgi:hypothetical protein|nr:hypothetical protein [Actinomycetes bacterium]MDX6345040.1 hypothetical protein [Trebonia sp.]